jgi:hypothetical protein
MGHQSAMTEPAPVPPPRPPRKVWKLALFAFGLAANLFALTLEVRAVMQGGPISFFAITTTIMCAVFAVLLYAELGKPKA